MKFQLEFSSDLFILSVCYARDFNTFLVDL